MSTDIEDRKYRGVKQKFYLISLEEKDKVWTIILEGITNRYTLHFSTEKIDCNCPDYENRGHICKHLYFIILKIAECYKILLDHDIVTQKKIKSQDFEYFNQNLKNNIQKYNNRYENPSKRQKITNECLICLEEINDDQANLECLSQCHKHFHRSCLLKWQKINQNCPHCRSINSFQTQNYENEYNSWSKIENINVEGID